MRRTCTVLPGRAQTELRRTGITPSGAGSTVTAQLAVNPPSTVLAVTVVVPAFLPKTVPSANTAAISISAEAQVTDLSSAHSGKTVATNFCVFPRGSVRVSASSSTPVTAYGFHSISSKYCEGQFSSVQPVVFPSW